MAGLAAGLLVAACGGDEGQGAAPDAGAPAAVSATPVEGKWRRARPDAGDAERLATLGGVPYLQGYRAAVARPLIGRHDRRRAYTGLNLYTSGHAAEAVLMDMDGVMVHRWGLPLRRLWPDLEREPSAAKLEYWRRARLLPGGDLLAIYEGLGLVRLDRESRPRWAYRGGAHHDLDVDPEGRVWLLDRRRTLLPRVHRELPVLEDLITVLDLEGHPLDQFSILECFERSPYAGLLRRMPPAGDILHTNTLEWLDGALPGEAAFARGNLLISVLQLDALAVVDPRRRQVVWALTGPWRRQHQPSLLPGGRLLLFDNLGQGGERSRVLEIEAASGRVRWQFGGADVDLFSKTLGSCQRLGNGNTLVVESENGRALEVTPAGESVWEFHSPHRAGERGELVAALFDLVRLPSDFPWRGAAAGSERGDGL